MSTMLRIAITIFVSIVGALFLGQQALLMFTDRTTPIEKTRALRQSGENAFPVISPQHFITGMSSLHTDEGNFLPLSGVASARTVFCNESGTYTVYQSDRFGFRNPDDAYHFQTNDLVLLGDSFAHGACVDDEATLAAQLRKTFPSVLNLGFGRQGPLSYLSTLVEYAEHHHPTQTVWLHYEGNDTYDLEDERKHPILKTYLSDSSFRQGLRENQSRIDVALRRLVEERLSEPAPSRWLLFSALQPLRLFIQQAVSETRFSPEPLGYLREADILETYTNVLGQAHHRVSQWGGRLLFVYLPEWRTFHDHVSSREDRIKIEQMVAREGLQFLDLTPRFLLGGDPLQYFPFRKFGHYNEKGYALVADAIRETLNGSETDKTRNTAARGIRGSLAFERHRSAARAE